MGIDPGKDKSGSKDWRGASSNMFDRDPVAMMVAMTLMHCYHAGSYSDGEGDPLESLLGVYKVDDKAIANAIKAEVDSKIAFIEALIKKRKAKAHQKATA